MDAVTKCGRGGGVTAIVEYDYTAKEADELDLVKGALIQNIKKLAGGWWEGTLQSTGKTGMFPDNFVRLVDLSEDNTVVLRDKSATANRRCKVIYSYTQVNEDELSLAVGDVIEFLGEVEEGWWRGRLKNKIGVFPSNFVVAIEPSPIFATKRIPSSNATTAMTVTSSTPKSTAAAAVGPSSSTNINTTVNNISSSGGSSKKKTNRLSLHSSKEDLLSSTTSSAKVTSSLVATTNASGEDAAPSLPPKPQREFCRVEFPYMPQNDDELYLRAGDIITIISTELPDKGWWKGELRGKVGVFPDNFVKLLPPEVSPLNDSHFATKTTKNSNATVDSFSNAGTSMGGTSAAAANLMNSVQSSSSSSAAAASATTTTTTTSTAKTNHTAISSSSSSSSKVFVKKSGSSSSSTQSTQGQSANRKESFGSRDSLNDILSETGLQTGNVAAARKSLENKNIDLLNVPDSGGRLAMKKVQHKQDALTATVTSEISSSSSTSANASGMGGSNSEMRKSLENLDEKTKTPPPVLTKKPLLGAKGILSGLKQKVKNVEKQLTSASSHDYADGISGSKASASNSGLPDACAAGNVVMRRAATIAVEDTDFDSVERTSILPDMRAGRVKAPRRRPPSVAYNTSGESNNNSTAYVNGGSGGGGDGSHEESLTAKPHSSDDNSTGDEQLLAKPKPREWQTQKAPWMEELKLSQVKKKASPNVEMRSGGSTTATTSATATATEKTRMSTEDTRISGSPSNAFSSSTTSSSSCSSAAVTSSKVQSSSISSSMVQQSMLVVESSQHHQQHMSKSMLIKGSADTTEDMRTRPNSLSIRNRSSSPSSSSSSATAVGRTSVRSSTPATSNAIATADPGQHTTASLHTTNHSSATATSASASAVHENNLAAPAKHNQSLTNSTSNINSNSISNSHSNHSAHSSMIGGNTEGGRVFDLERRVEKLEAVVYAQQRTIDELVRTLREETDRVKVLRGELDKYAQCVTQV